MPRPEEVAVLTALEKFADAVTAKMTTITAGEPEDQLRGPFETFFEEVGTALARKIVCTGETRLAGRLGKPDYAIHANDLLSGYVELITLRLRGTESARRRGQHKTLQGSQSRAIQTFLRYLQLALLRRQ